MFVIGRTVVNPTPLLLAAGVAVGHFGLILRARRLGLNTATAGEMSMWTILLGFVGGHLFSLLQLREGPGAILQSPLIALQVFNGFSSFGVLLGGLVGGALYLRRQSLAPLDWWQYLDAGVFVFPLAWSFARLSCSLIHDHPGVQSTNWLAVNFPRGPRHDLGLLELTFTFALLAGFAWFDRRPRAPGFYFGSFLVSYGLFRLSLVRLEIDPVRYFGWSVTGSAATAAILAGLVTLWAIQKDRVPTV